MAEINLKDYPTLDKYTHPVKKPEREIVGRDAEKKSIFASFLRPELCNVILLGDAGSGKAHPNDTLLPSPCEDGYIRLGDIKVGDKVYDENGKPVIVKGVYPRGLKRVFRVTFKDGRSVLCNDDHIWHVRNLNAHNKGRSYKNLTLKEIMKEGVKKVKVSKNRKPRNLNNWYIPVNEAVYRDEKKYVLDPYVLGVIIGDGCVSDLKSQMNVSSSDESVIKEVSKRLGSYGYVRNEHNYNWLFLKAPEDESRNFYQVHDFPDKSDELLSVFGKLSKEKSIPRSYMLGSIDQRFKLLQGLLDTDGYVSNNDRLNVKFSTASEKLAKDVVELSNSLGIRTTLTRFDRTYKDRPDSTEYEIYFITDIETRRSLFYACDRKIAIFEKYLPNRVRKFNRRYDDLAITNVEDLGYDTEMTCIYVDSESHLYQVGKEHIVTHNTALVQSCAIEDIKRHYREVDLSKMISELDDMDKLANLIKTMFAEASKYSREMGKEVVMFIDEFHQIIHLSKAAVEALKPILADSGTRGLRIIFATTFEEFEEFVKPNQALVERLERINIRGASKELVIKILKGMSKRYKVDHLFYNDSIYELIYEYTNRYIPANSQPRKSILVLDRMIGWHRYSGRAMDFSLLADVLAESEGVNVNFKVKANEIKDRLNRKVLAQEFAVDAVTQRLFICVAGLNNPGKPMGSFLFTGSTGVGKLLSNSVLVPVFDPKVKFKYHGDLKPGDMVFNRLGEPVKITETFKHKNINMYDVILNDGRVLPAGEGHLWTVYTSKQRQKIHSGNYKTYPKGEVITTKELLDRGLYREKGNRRELKYYINMNEAVNWTENDLKVDPYVVGSFIADGCLTLPALSLSNDDEEIIDKVSSLIGAKGHYLKKMSYTHLFLLSKKAGNRKLFHTKDLFSDMPEIMNKKSHEKSIPEIYMTGSIDQRWKLIQGLFDCDGSVSDDKRCRVSYFSTSKDLVYDIQKVLYSLGIASSITTYKRSGKNTEYTLRVKTEMENKFKFFTLQRKLDIIKKWQKVDERERVKKFDFVGIKEIKYTGVEDAQCIMVDDPEHLYQAGDFVVTHNTQLAKEMTNILFDDDKAFIRFDMTEFALDESLERFRDTLTNRVFENPNSIILLDEIEKASKAVTHVLLQVLDDGRLLDKYNREVSFVNSYIILTTNVASDLYSEMGDYTSDTADRREVINRYMNLVKENLRTTSKDKFPPELLGRIDSIAPFMPLQEETLMKICIMELAKIKTRVRKIHNMDLIVTEKTVRFIVRDLLIRGSDSGGARQLLSIIDSNVNSVIAEYVSKYPYNKQCVIDVHGDIASDNKNKRENKGVYIFAADKEQ